MTGLPSIIRVGPIGPSPVSVNRLPVPSASAFRSKPAQKLPPAPVSTATLSPGSASKSRNAAANSRAVLPSTAFRRSGRSIVMITTGSRRSSFRPPSRPSHNGEGVSLDDVVIEELLAAETPDVELNRLHPLQQRRQVGLVPELDADQGRTALLVGLLDVLEADDIVGRAERIVDELAQLPRLLRELDDEIVLAALIDEAALHDLGIAQDVVVAATQDADDRLPWRHPGILQG